jgi:hypothetical protein
MVDELWSLVLFLLFSDSSDEEQAVGRSRLVCLVFVLPINMQLCCKLGATVTKSTYCVLCMA